MNIDIERSDIGTIVSFDYKSRRYNVLVADAKDRYRTAGAGMPWYNNNNRGGEYVTAYDVLTGDVYPNVYPGACPASRFQDFVVPDAITLSAILCIAHDIAQCDPTSGDFGENVPTDDFLMSNLIIQSSTPAPYKNEFITFTNGSMVALPRFYKEQALVIPVKFL